MSLSRKTQGVEILPAILVKSREQFLEQLELVRPHVKGVHIDIMDNVFVPNETLGMDELKPLPSGDWVTHCIGWWRSPKSGLPSSPGRTCT